MSASAADHTQLERVYVWEVPVRLTHWLLVGSIFVLTITGLYIGNPFLSIKGEATRHFAMGLMKSVHFSAAIVFTLAVIVRFFWMFAGNPYARWTQLIPTTKERLIGIWKTFAFYTFLHKDTPAFIGHNPLAGSVYVVVFALMTVMISTGFAMVSASAPVDSFLTSFQFLIPLFGGLQMTRFIHHIVMWLILGFAAHHIWSAFLIGIVEKSALLDSIFSGYKVLTPDMAERARRRIEADK